LALQLRQELLNSGGRTTTSGWPPTVSHTPSSPSSTGSAGGTSCIQGKLLIGKGTRAMGTRLL
jgi:hypothetical protein